ncbi:unnamed protein product [Adineta steineri]|uniref:Uncharacterized protein n=1 Tax=Adineta steineri TaxID=433720 RepID=A0A819TK98_9BILA|nr:unnamed protein product [Adineta steineri]
MPKEKILCSVCHKEAGICNCTGCKAFFCMKDFANHRQWLSGEFEKVIEARNRLQEVVSDRKILADFRAALYTYIDQWKTDALDKIQYTAEKTRVQTAKILDDKIQDVDNGLHGVTEQLRAMQDMNNYVEDDLDQLNDHIENIMEEFKHLKGSSEIRICKENSEQLDWNSLIYVDNQRARDHKVTIQKKFQVDVLCPSADVNCPWTGPSDELSSHLVTCTFTADQSKVQRLHDITKRLKEQIKQQRIRIDGSEFEIHQLTEQLEQRKNEVDAGRKAISQLKDQFEQQEVRINLSEGVIRQMKGNMKQQKAQKDANEVKNRHMREQLKQLEHQVHGKDGEWYWRLGAIILAVMLSLTLLHIFVPPSISELDELHGHLQKKVR